MTKDMIDDKNGNDGMIDTVKTKKKRPRVVQSWQILQKEVERLDAKRRQEKYIPDPILTQSEIALFNATTVQNNKQKNDLSATIDYLFGFVGKGNYLQIAVNVNAAPFAAYKGARHPHTIVLHERMDSDGIDLAADGQSNFLMLYHDDESQVRKIDNGVNTKRIFYNKVSMQSFFKQNISDLFSNSNIYTLTDEGRDINPDITIYHINGITGQKTRQNNSILFNIPTIKNFMTGNKNRNRLTIAMEADNHDLIDTVLLRGESDGEIPPNFGFPAQMLNMAVQKNAINVTSHLLDLVDAQRIRDQINPEYYVFVAAREGNLDMMDMLINRGFDPAAPVSSRGNQLPLHAAITHGKIEAAEKLLAAAPQTLNRSPCGIDVPLVLAVAHNQPETAKFLVQQGADVNCMDGNGNVAIVSAARIGNIGMVRYLHDHGARLEPTNNNPACAPFVAAANAGKAQVMEYLAPHVHIDQQDICGRTALFAAAQNGHGHIIPWLIQKGASIDTPDENGETAYRQAVSNNHLDIAQDLLDAGANPFAIDNEGKDILTKVKQWGEKDLERFCLKVMRAAEEKVVQDGRIPAWRDRRNNARHYGVDIR